MVSLRVVDLLDPDGKVGAEDLAEMAGRAGFRLDHVRRVVALEVVSRGKSQDVARAELDAISAALAALLQDPNLALQPGYLSRIQRNSPEPL
jgi:hypothetical protein